MSSPVHSLEPTPGLSLCLLQKPTAKTTLPRERFRFRPLRLLLVKDALFPLAGFESAHFFFEFGKRMRNSDRKSKRSGRNSPANLRLRPYRRGVAPALRFRPLRLLLVKDALFPLAGFESAHFFFEFGHVLLKKCADSKPARGKSASFTSSRRSGRNRKRSRGSKQTRSSELAALD
jgi:hypothetical protein